LRVTPATDRTFVQVLSHSTASSQQNTAIGQSSPICSICKQ